MLLTALPGQLPATDPTNGDECFLSEAQAVLLNINPTDGNDGFIGFNSNFQWSYTHTDDPGKFDFIEVALHEITHVLGRTSLVSIDGLYTQYDLFRFAADGT